MHRIAERARDGGLMCLDWLGLGGGDMLSKPPSLNHNPGPCYHIPNYIPTTSEKGKTPLAASWGREGVTGIMTSDGRMKG